VQLTAEDSESSDEFPNQAPGDRRQRFQSENGHILNFSQFSQRSSSTTSFRLPVIGGLILCSGILIITFGSVLFMGYDALESVLPLQTGLLFASLFLLFLFNRPQVGIVCLLAGGLLVKPEIDTGTQSALNFAFLLCPVLIAIWLLRLLFQREQERPILSSTVVPIKLFMITACLAFLVGQYPWFSMPAAPMQTQAAQLTLFIFSGCLFLIAARQLQDIRWLKVVTYTFIGIGFIPLLPRIVPASVFSSWSFLPEGATAGSMFWTWLVALSFGQVILNRDLHLWGKLTLSLVALTTIALGFAELGWMSGWVPPLISVAIILFLRFPIPVLLLSPIISVLALMDRSQVWSLLTIGDNVYSLDTRAAAMKSLLPIIKVNPLLGLGPANYYQYTSLSPILGWHVRFNSHNNYFDLIAQTGIVGLVCFLWFAWAAGRTAWRLRSRPTTGFESAYVCSVFAGLLATLAAAYLGDWVIPFVYNTGLTGFRTSIIPWIFIGGLVALEQRWALKT
jgi:O-antigen ligase